MHSGVILYLDVMNKTQTRLLLVYI